MAKKKHYMDLNPIEQKEIVLSPTPIIRDGYTYTTQELGPDLIMIWADDSEGERLPASLGVIPSKMDERISRFIQETEKQDQTVKIRISSRLLEKANAHAEKNNQNFSELIRSLLESL